MRAQEGTDTHPACSTGRRGEFAIQRPSRTRFAVREDKTRGRKSAERDGYTGLVTDTGDHGYPDIQAVEFAFLRRRRTRPRHHCEGIMKTMAHFIPNRCHTRILPGQGSARRPGDLCDARKPTPRPTTVKGGSDDCCWGSIGDGRASGPSVVAGRRRADQQIRRQRRTDRATEDPMSRPS
jgi:hypothetical protein